MVSPPAKSSEAKKRWREAYRKTPAAKAYSKEYMKRYAKRMHSERKAWLREFKSGLACAKCGYNEHPAALQFHHLRDKINTVSMMVLNSHTSMAKVMEEIAKCIVLCANCHAILHDEEQKVPDVQSP